jgi:homopolymeric O-antigen transport system permease protein
LNPGALWARRELLYFLIWRDIKVRYKQTFLGAVWALVHPVVTVIVYGTFFGWLAKIPSEGLPYPVFAFSALLPWQLFSSSVTASSNSLVANQQLITKVNFPRLVLPIATVAIVLVDFAIAMLALCAMMLFYGMVPTKMVWTLPAFVLLSVTMALGVGTWLSAINVRFRDIGHIVPFLLQTWMFATPIFYPIGLIPEQWRSLYALNPMVGVIEGFRWALFGSGPGPGPELIGSVVMAFVLLLSGMYFFRRVEQTFADVV